MRRAAGEKPAGPVTVAAAASDAPRALSATAAHPNTLLAPAAAVAAGAGVPPLCRRPPRFMSPPGGGVRKWHWVGRGR